MTNVISRSSKVREICDGVVPSVLCRKIKRKNGGLILLPVCFLRTFKVTLLPGPINSGLSFCFHSNLQNSLLLLQSGNSSVYERSSDISSDQKRSQIDRTKLLVIYLVSSDHVFSGGSFFAAGCCCVDLLGTAWKTSFCRSSEEDAWPKDKPFIWQCFAAAKTTEWWVRRANDSWSKANYFLAIFFHPLWPSGHRHTKRWSLFVRFEFSK